MVSKSRKGSKAALPSKKGKAKKKAGSMSKTLDTTERNTAPSTTSAQIAINKELLARATDPNVSHSIPGAVLNLMASIPPALFRALATKIIKFFNSYFQSMLKVILSIDSKASDWDKEVDKSKRMTKILFYVTTEVLKQPDVQKLFLEMAEELKNVLDQIATVLKASLKRLKILIDEEGEIVQQAVYTQTYQVTEKILSAIIAAVSAIPVVGNVITAVVAGAEIITPIQTITEQSIIVFIKTADKIIDLLNEVSVPGLDAAQSSIKVIKNVLKTSQTIINKIDTVRGALEDIPQKGGAKVPWPSFTPSPDSIYIEATKPHAGLNVPPSVEKAIKDMSNMAKEVNDAKKKAKEKLNDAKQKAHTIKSDVEKGKKMAQNLKNAPKKLKAQANKEIKDIKKELKKSTKKIALKGGRRSRSRKHRRKNIANRRRSRKK